MGKMLRKLRSYTDNIILNGILIVLCLLQSWCVGQLPDREERLNNYRLPGDLWPDHYNLEFQPFIYNASDGFYFTGNATVFMTCRRATTEVIINVYDLEPDQNSVTFTRAPGSSAPTEPVVTSWEINSTAEFLILQLEAPLVVDGTYQLEMTYTQQLNFFGGGMYVTSYDIDGDTRFLTATQFNRNYARQTFPCFDEPEYKATYNVTMVRKSHYKSLSNMNIIRQEERGDDWIADIYNTTVRMSTYLLELIVCDFEYVESTSPNGHVTRIWARPNAIEHTSFALSVAGRFLDFLEDYTNFSYSLPKMDHIGIPNIGIPAMEHWGMITYPERALLYNPQIDSTASKQSKASVISHELAHQWFGNLVTQAWWDHTWVNEGITSFFNYIPPQGVLGWPAEELHTITSTRSIMGSDSTNRSQPVVVEIRTPNQAITAFNSITYSKGSSLMYMFRNVLSEATFRRGLQRYLQRHQYDVGSTDDVWRAFQEQADQDGITEPDGSPLNVTEKFDPWVRQMGYPLVSVSRDDLDLDVDEARVTQAHYLDPPGQIMPPSAYNYRWNIPITTYHADDFDGPNTETDHWLDRQQETVLDGFPFPLLWSVINVDWGAFYRVEYDDGSRDALLAQLEIDHEEIPVINRAFLIENEFELTRLRNQEMTSAMDFTRFLEDEIEYVPWQAANLQMGYISRMLTRSDVSGALSGYMRMLSELVYDTEGGGDWTNLTPPLNHTKLLLRDIIVPVACNNENENCEQNASETFNQWRQNTNTTRVHPDLQLPVWCTAVRVGGSAEWDFLYSEYQRASVSADASRYQAALACSTNRTIIQRYFQHYMDGDVPIRSALYMVDNPVGEEIIWNYLRNNWLSADRSAALTLFAGITDSFNSDVDLQELQAHINQYPADDEATALAYDLALVTTNENIAWMARNKEPLRDWLEAEVPEGDVIYSTNSPGWGYQIAFRYQRFEQTVIENAIFY